MKRLLTLLIFILSLFLLVGLCSCDGEVGPQGETGEQGPQGEKGEQGEQGEAGVGIAKTEIVNGELVITYTDGRVVSLGPIVQEPEAEEKPNFTEGLKFLYFEENDTYAVSAGDAIYNCEIIIPSEYNGKPVTAILNGAFTNAKASKMYIPSSVTTIENIGSSLSVIYTDLKEKPEGWYVDGNLEVVYDVKIGITDYGLKYAYGEDRQVIIWGCDYSKESASIPRTIDGMPVVKIGIKAFYKNQQLKNITIFNSVKEIDESAFFECDNLTSVTIPNSVKSIGSYAFRYCDSLTNVTIGDSVTSIGYGAFRNCTSLTSITVDENNTAYKSIDGVLYSKDGTTLICYPAGKTDTSFVIPNNVTSIGSYAFSGCTSLTSVTIPDSVTSIGYGAFYNCTSLTSVTIPNSVTSIGSSTFSGCTSLTSITIPFVGATKDGTSNTHFGYIFGASSYSNNSNYVPSSLKEVIITGGSSIGASAFSGCSSLTSVTIPNSVTSIGDDAFYNCTSLTSITIPFVGATKDGTSNTHFGYIFGASSYPNNDYYVPSSLKEVIITGGSIIDNYAFYRCTSLTSITIPDSVTSIGDHAFYNCDSLTSVTIGDSVTSIGSSAFSWCTSLTSITIPNSVTSIGSDAFEFCYKLVEVYNLSSLNITAGSSNNGYAGSYAKVIHTSLDEASILETVNDYIFMTWEDKYYLMGYVGDETELTLPESYKGNNYEIYQYAFYDNDKITKVTIPNSVTSIGDNAFRYCTSLKSITIPNSVTSIGDSAFYNCESLTSVTIGNSVTSIGSSAFYNCESLTSVTIPNSVTSIGYMAFYNCTSLTSITIPDSVTSIGNYAFEDCTSLTSVTIGNSVKSIGSYAFSGCTSLTSVTIPDSVTSIGYGAFYNCTSLTIYCEAKSKPSGWDSSWNYSNRPVVWNYHNQ